MKKSLILLAAVLLSACSLEEEMTSLVSPKNFFNNEAECKAALNACYIPVRNIYNYPFFFAVECCADLMFCNSNTLDSQLDISPANPRCAETVWNQCWLGVKNANTTFAGIAASGLDESLKNELLGEAVVMRSFYYYILTSFFGDVPFWEDDITSTERLLEIARLPRMDAKATRSKLIEELKEFAPLMPQQRTCEDPEHRCRAAVAWMLIGKLAMWNEQWQDAVDALGHIEEIYGDFSQYPLSDIPFSNHNVPESIMEVQHKYVLGGINYTTALASVCTPRRQTGTDIYDGVQIPELGNMSVTYNPARPNLYYTQNFIAKDSNDLRKDINLAWGWKGRTFTNAAGERGFLGPKFWCWNMQNDADGNNYKIFRYADALLMLSECWCMLRDQEKAVACLNLVKERAGLSPYRFRNYPALMEEIQTERGRELFGEFQRKFDLVRWGIWYFQTKNYNDFSKIKLNIRPFHEYYPIPDVEVKNSGNALDNKAYEGGNI